MLTTAHISVCVCTLQLEHVWQLNFVEIGENCKQPAYHLQSEYCVKDEQLPSLLHLPLVPGGGAAEAPGGEERAWARGDPESFWGEQQLHQERQGEAGAEDGGQQGEQGGSAGSHAGEAAGEGNVATIKPRASRPLEGRSANWSQTIIALCGFSHSRQPQNTRVHLPRGTIIFVWGG